MTRAAPQAGRMTLWEHLDELRARIVKALIAYAVGSAVAWYQRDRILAWLWKPFARSWGAQHIEGDPALNFAAPSDTFKAYFKLSLTAGLLIAAPMMFYQLWGFVAPGLYKKEKRYVIPFVLCSSVLFVGGALFGWQIGFPLTFEYFLGLAASSQTAGVSVRPVMMMGPYIDFVSQMLVAFGLVFELPVLILFLSIAGVVNYKQLIRFGRWFILIAFTIGAVLTPPELTSQLAMSIPLCILYFLSIGLAYLFGKRPPHGDVRLQNAGRPDGRGK
jgi:sec-independent protein translocase protein TatC